MIAKWFFFGVLCMNNAPADCERIVFDVPRFTAAWSSRYDMAPPPSFATERECQAALRAELARTLPLKVMGSTWTQTGCARQ